RTARHLHPRRPFLVDRHAAVQLPVHRPALLPDRERPSRRPTARRRLPGHDDGLLGLARGGRRSRHVPPRRCDELRQGPAPAGRRRVGRLPGAAAPRRQRAQHGRRGRALTMAQVQEFVEQALQLSSVDGCVVVAAEHTETNLRWANNSLTTNGQMSSRSVTVISVAGESAGVVTRSVSTADELAALVKASEAAAQDASPADDFAPLVEPYDTDDDWDVDPATTSEDVFARFAPELGTAFKQAGKNGRLLFGFAEHEMTSVFVGSSTGLRRRYDQPNGRLELNGKSDDYTRSAWAG